MTEEEIIRIIIGEAIYIHRTVGPGLLESVYQNCLAHRLKERGLRIEVEKPIPVFFETVHMECGYRADIVVENKIVIETKNIEAIADVHIAQMLTYLRMLNHRYGLLLNFRTALMKEGIRRVINGNFGDKYPFLNNQETDQ